MKRIMMLIAVFVVSASIVSAQDVSSDKARTSMMGQGMMTGGGMMGGGMMGMMRGMMNMRGMMHSSMIATSDGGVIVLNGGKLTKYDKDLNVVKEVTLQDNTQDMQKMMSTMTGKCSDMMGMMNGMMGNSTWKDKDDDTNVDHASHHQ